VGTGHQADKTHIQITAGAFTKRGEDTSAKLLTTEQKKPLHEAKEKILGPTHIFEYYAAILPKYGYVNVVKKTNRCLRNNCAVEHAHNHFRMKGRCCSFP
jgi:acyl-CoA reductase-like NAD-dependent aldehyde dehydrogenase